MKVGRDYIQFEINEKKIDNIFSLFEFKKMSIAPSINIFFVKRTNEQYMYNLSVVLGIIISSILP